MCNATVLKFKMAFLSEKKLIKQKFENTTLSIALYRLESQYFLDDTKNKFIYSFSVIHLQTILSIYVCYGNESVLLTVVFYQTNKINQKNQK